MLIEENEADRMPYRALARILTAECNEPPDDLAIESGEAPADKLWLAIANFVARGAEGGAALDLDAAREAVASAASAALSGSGAVPGWIARALLGRESELRACLDVISGDPDLREEAVSWGLQVLRTASKVGGMRLKLDRWMAEAEEAFTLPIPPPASIDGRGGQKTGAPDPDLRFEGSRKRQKRGCVRGAAPRGRGAAHIAVPGARETSARRHRRPSRCVRTQGSAPVVEGPRIQVVTIDAQSGPELFRTVDALALLYHLRVMVSSRPASSDR